MAEKEDSTRLSAPTASAEGSQNGQVKNSRQPTSEDVSCLAHDKDDMERETIMEPAWPSELCKTPRGMVDRSLQAQLGRQLRAIFSDVAQEPVPDRFIKLLEALEAREKLR